MKTLNRILDFIFGVPDEIVYNKLLADRLQDLIDKHKDSIQNDRPGMMERF